jgi:hypothetical protein
MIDDECGAVDGIKLTGETELVGGNLPQCNIFHKSHIP